ncbi:Fc.00g027980.m01.CDS01 [Cosmosporella sp. VM-42]
MAVLSITAISDNVCPFCYIGLLRLTRALSLYRKVVPNGSCDTITTTWHAYQLDPTATAADVATVSAKMAAKHGADKVPALQERLKKIGLKDGVLFSFESKIGNTRDSHRVVVLARGKGNDVENQVVLEIMRMYFEEGGDITSHEDLIRAAKRAGLDEDETRTWLESDQGGEEVDCEAAEARKMGVVGVPRFIINDKFIVDGAEEVNAFLEQLVLAKQEAEGETEAEIVS